VEACPCGGRYCSGAGGYCDAEDASGRAGIVGASDSASGITGASGDDAAWVVSAGVSGYAAPEAGSGDASGMLGASVLGASNESVMSSPRHTTLAPIARDAGHNQRRMVDLAHENARLHLNKISLQSEYSVKGTQ